MRLYISFNALRKTKTKQKVTVLYPPYRQILTHVTWKDLNASGLASHGSKEAPSVALYEQWWCIVGVYKTRNVLDNVSFMKFVFPTAVKILAPCRHVGEFQRVEEAYCVHLFFYPKRAGLFLKPPTTSDVVLLKNNTICRKWAIWQNVTLFLVNSLHFFFICHLKLYTGCSITASFNKMREEDKCLDRITVSSNAHSRQTCRKVCRKNFLPPVYEYAGE